MDKEIMMEDRISLGRLTATITKIWWERIIVHIDLQLTYADEALKGEKFDVYAVDQNFHAKARFKQTIVDEEHIRLSMNTISHCANLWSSSLVELRACLI